MILALNNRVYTTGGEIFTTLEDLKQFNQNNPLRVIKSSLSTLKFIIKEHIIFLELDGEHYPFSMTGFKSVCSLLKVPASYLNKSLSDELILQNLNNNPLKVEEEIRIYLRKTIEFEFVSAITVNDPMTSDDLVEIIENTHFEMNNELKACDVTISNEEIVIYHLKEKETLATGQSIARGTAIVFGEGVDLGFSIHSFSRFYFGESSYDFFNSKALKKVSRKEKSYKIMIQDELRHFDLNSHEKNFEDSIKLLNAAEKTKEISYSFLKMVKSAINRTYSFQAGIYDTSLILEQLLPEFDHFKEEYKEEIKLLPTFEQNNIMLPFHLPKLFQMFENETTTLENPLFFNRQRRNVYKLLVKNAENFFRNV